MYVRNVRMGAYVRKHVRIFGKDRQTAFTLKSVA